jgi:hypothetical protein
VVETDGEKEIVFGSGATGYSPVVFNQILAAYGY